MADFEAVEFARGGADVAAFVADVVGEALADFSEEGVRFAALAFGDELDAAVGQVGTRAIFEHYCSWCKSRNESPAKINKLSQLLGKLGFKRAYQIGDQRAKGYSGLKIKGENKHQYLKQIRRGSDLKQPQSIQLPSNTK
jgi:hypothetical protein